MGVVDDKLRLARMMLAAVGLVRRIIGWNAHLAAAAPTGADVRVQMPG